MIKIYNFQFQVGDILQVSNDAGATWRDYGKPLQTPSEGRYAEIKVRTSDDVTSGRRFRVIRPRRAVFV